MGAVSQGMFSQQGTSLDYINETTEIIAPDQVVVIGERIGIAGCEIAPGDLGSLHVTGVFRMPKTDGSSDEFSMGDAVKVDADGFVDSAGDVTAGFAAASSKAADPDVLVKINA